MSITRKYRKSSKISKKNPVKRTKKIKRTHRKKVSLNLGTYKKRRSLTKKTKSRKNKLRKIYKGGNTTTREPITPIPVIIDDDSIINEDELNQMELDLADDSFASYYPPTPNTSIMNSSMDEGETTTEDISFDREDEDEDDILNTGFYEE